MAPRPYALGKRALQAAQTRERIVEAAMALYQKQSIRETSMHDIARKADVAPATVLNHFRTPDDLAAATLRRILETLRLPTSAIFQGARTTEQRARRLVGEMFEFYDRSNTWFEMYQRDR